MRDPLKSEFLQSTTLTPAAPKGPPLPPIEGPSSSVEFVPVKIPQSITMLCEVLRDIAASSYGIPRDDFAYFTDLYDDGSFGITMKLAPHKMPAYTLYAEKRLEQMLDDLEIMDFKNQLQIDKTFFEIISPSKIALYKAIDEMLEALPRSVTPEDIEFKKTGYDRDIEDQQVTEYMSKNAAKARKLGAETAGAYQVMLSCVESRPYSSMTHFESAMCAGKNATVRIPMSHVFRTICREEHVSVSEIKYGTYGGLN